MTKEEIWKPVYGHETRYEISSHGRVRALERQCVPYGKFTNGKTYKPRAITPFPRRPSGHLQVKLYHSGVFKTLYVHRLVLFTFVGPPPNSGFEACHNNGMPSDNRLENLRWDTPSANQLDKIKHGFTPLRGERIGTSLLSAADIALIRGSARTAKDIANDYGVSRSTIYAVRSRQNWRHI